MKKQRCPNCGGRLSHYITDINGQRYYKCTTGLTTIPVASLVGGGKPGKTSINSCDTVVTVEDGKVIVFKGFIAYRTEGRVETYLV